MWHLHPGRVMEVAERQLLRTSVLVLVLLFTWSCLVVVVLPCRTVCHPQKTRKSKKKKKRKKTEKKMKKIKREKKKFIEQRKKRKKKKASKEDWMQHVASSERK